MMGPFLLLLLTFHFQANALPMVDDESTISTTRKDSSLRVPARTPSASATWAGGTSTPAKRDFSMTKKKRCAIGRGISPPALLQLWIQLQASHKTDPYE